MSFSANDQFLLSASADKSCYVWNLAWAKKGEKLLLLDHIFRPKVSDMLNSQSSAIGTEKKTLGKKDLNPEFAEPIKQAQFFYDDRLIVLASGDKV